MTEERCGPAILVAVDPPAGAPESASVQALALATGWPVELVHAATPGTPPDEIERLRRALERAADALRSQRIEADGRVHVGPPVDVVLVAAEAIDAAVIVVVGHRRSTGGRTALGSFASALLKVSDRPVLVVPAGPPVVEPGFVAAVERLLDLIDRSEPSTSLDELREAAQAELESPTSDEGRRHRGGRLLDALHRFETDHPTLTSAINDVSYYLSGMGI